MEAIIFTVVVFAVGYMLGAEHNSADSQADHVVEFADHTSLRHPASKKEPTVGWEFVVPVCDPKRTSISQRDLSEAIEQEVDPDDR